MLPKNKPLSELDILKFSKNLSCFRGVFMRDKLPTHVFKNECAIINLDEFKGSGTHWVCYYKKNNCVYYFDSYGNLRPPLELINYLGSRVKILYNYKRHQNYDTIICGHLCIRFLYDVDKKIN